MKECVDDLPYFLSAKSIVDGKAQFVKGLRAGKGQTTSKGKNSSKKKTSMDERTSRKYKRRFKGDSSRSDIMGAWQKRKYNRKK